MRLFNAATAQLRLSAGREENFHHDNADNEYDDDDDYHHVRCVFELCVGW